MENHREFDMKHKLYFLTDEAHYIELDVTEDAHRIKAHQQQYIQRQDNPFYEYLFESSAYPYKTVYYRFLMVVFQTFSGGKRQEIIDLIRELANPVDLLIIKGHLVFFYDDDNEFRVQHLLETINDDFSVALKCYESGPVRFTHPEDFMKLFDAYCLYSLDNPRLYTATVDLIFDIVRHQYDGLKALRDPILKGIDHDPHMESVVQGMFECDLNISQTAHQVYMHRNTVMNKIDTIEQMTGLSIQNFYEAVALYMLFKAK
ncbi:MAG: helix-turn-helix domain-containing protein [Bacilli bacterium]